MGILGVLLVVVVVGYYSFRSSRDKSPNSSAIVCDHTEDTGFYEELDPEKLPAYQAVLNQIFSRLDASRFNGTLVPLSQRETVDRLIAEAAAHQQLNPRYLRVMLYQFLQADSMMRRNEEVFARWAERVVELDRTGVRHGPRGIPSAWKVYFNTSMQMEACDNQSPL